MDHLEFKNGLFEYEVVCIQEFNEKSDFNKALFSLSSERQKVIQNKANEIGKMHSLAATVALDRLLKRVFPDGKVAEASMTYRYNDTGKPFFEKPEDLYFSISHSGEYALAVISGHPVGCDIEEHKDNREKVVSKVFTATEKNSYYALDPVDRQKFFFDAWTLKESFLKAIGEGLRFPMNKVEFSDGNIRLLKSGFEGEYTAEMLKAPEGYSASVVVWASK